MIKIYWGPNVFLSWVNPFMVPYNTWYGFEDFEAQVYVSLLGFELTVVK